MKVEVSYHIHSILCTVQYFCKLRSKIERERESCETSLLNMERLFPFLYICTYILWLWRKKSIKIIKISN